MCASCSSRGRASATRSRRPKSNGSGSTVSASRSSFCNTIPPTGSRTPQRVFTQEVGMTRNRIFGLIGVLWGGAILIGRLVAAPAAPGGGAYGAGQSAGLIFAILLLGVGAYFLFKKPK